MKNLRQEPPRGSRHIPLQDYSQETVEGPQQFGLDLHDSQLGSYRLWFRIERIIETLIALLALFTISMLTLQFPLVVIFDVAMKALIDPEYDSTRISFIVLGSILACLYALPAMSMIIYEALLFVSDGWQGFIQYQKLLGIKEFSTKKKIIKMFIILVVFIVTPIIVALVDKNSRSDYNKLARLFIGYVIISLTLFGINLLLRIYKSFKSRMVMTGSILQQYLLFTHDARFELFDLPWNAFVTSPFIITSVIVAIAVGFSIPIAMSNDTYQFPIPLIVFPCILAILYCLEINRIKAVKADRAGSLVFDLWSTLTCASFDIFAFVIWVCTLYAKEYFLGLTILVFGVLKLSAFTLAETNRITKFETKASNKLSDILAHHLDQIRFYDVGMYYKIIPPAGLKRSEVEPMASAWRIDFVEKISKYVGIVFVITSVLMVVATGWSINFDTKYGGAMANSAKPYLSGQMKTPLASRICSVEVGGYNTLDYAYFSQIAYLPHDEAREATNVWFGPYVFIDTPVADFDENLFYYGFMNGNTFVISIRGPTDLKSWSVMSQIWRGSVTYQVLRFMLPWMYMWPNESGAMMLNAVHKMTNRLASAQENNYVDKVVEYVEEMKANGREVILTGHSFGGGIAQVAAARTKTPAVTFSSPGIRLAYKTFDIADLDDAHDYGMNIYQSLDLVATIDKQGILAQELKCRGKISECQTIREGICEISNICGDPSGRDIILEPPSDVMCPNHNRIRL